MASDVDIDPEFDDDDDDNNHSGDINFDILRSDCKYITEGQIKDFFCLTDQASLNFLHINCRSLKKNFGPITNLLNFLSGPLSAIMVTETWLSESLQDVFTIQGYNFFSKSRCNKSEGGVGIYVNASFDCKIRLDLCYMNEYIECIFVECRHPGQQTIIVGSVYRPPNSDVSLFNSDLLSILNNIHLGSRNNLVIIAGDFNLNLLSTISHAATADFVNNMMSYNFISTISNPTRITEQSATLIDNIFVNSVKYDYCSAIVYSDISDHLPIALHLKRTLPTYKVSKKAYLTKRFFDANSIENFNCHLARNNWNDLYLSLTNVNTSHAYDYFANEYKSIFNKHFPEKNIKLSNRMTPRHPWMTKGLMKSCVKKSKLYRQFCNKKTPASKQRYIDYRKHLKRLLDKAEQDYYRDKFKIISGNIKETWKLLGSIFGKNVYNDTINCFNVNGVDINNKQEIVDKFNDYFVSIGSRLAALIPDSPLKYYDYLKTPNLKSFALYPTNAAEVIEIVSNFKNKWSAGADSIPINIVKASIVNIAEPISRLINSSFTTGIFPDSLKIAKVCPIYKSGEKGSFSNYRPISILPSFSKIFEKAVSIRLMSFLQSNDILMSNQYGFRKNHSSYMAIIDMYDKISKAIDEGQYAVGVFVDLSKAFDTLDHNILLAKLEYYGVRGICLEWFTNYLYNRKQYVYLNGASSVMSQIVCGVPQGSVLGPLLFILYINDIPNCSNILKFILFADDTNLFYCDQSLSELENIMNVELSKLSIWFRSNKLSLNAAKTNFILFGYKRIPFNANIKLTFDGNVLERVAYTKFLGVYFDEKLTWSYHLNHIANKISRGLGVMGRCRKILSNDTLVTLYFSLIYPYLYYCCIVWAGASATALHKLEVLQNRAVRLVTRSQFRASASPLFKQLHLLKIQDIRKIQIYLFMYKCKNALLPASCMHYCITHVHNPYNMRSNHDFVTPLYRTNIREQSISVLGPKVWESLPIALRVCESFDILKRVIRDYFISMY